MVIAPSALAVEPGLWRATQTLAGRYDVDVVDLLCVAWARASSPSDGGQQVSLQVALDTQATETAQAAAMAARASHCKVTVALDQRPIAVVVRAVGADRTQAPVASAVPQTADPQGDSSTGPVELLVQFGVAGLRLRATAAEQLVADDACHRVRGALEHLVHLLDTEPNAPACALRCLAPSRRTQIVDTWNTVPAHPVEQRCLHELFEAQARLAPRSTALVLGDERLDYGELNARANRLARHLATLGVRPDAVVAIAIGRSIDLVVAVLATLKAGAAYVPLDPSYPSDRLAHMLADSDPAVLLVRGRAVAALGPIPASLHVVDLERDAHRWADAAPTNIPVGDVGVQPSNLAYLIYTSGSTGRPKGVMVEHANVARLFSSTAQWFGFGPDDVWTLFHSTAFDFSVWELWGALLHGGTLVIVPYLVSRSPAEFYRLVCDERVTVLNQTPSAFRQLIAAQAEAGDCTHCLRSVIFGGEALELATLKPWYDANRGAATQLVNMYGITETTVHVTYLALTAEDAQRGGPSPIGVRIPDLRTYILDDACEPVPPGVVGELYVGGAGVARGYLRRPELTAVRFLPDRFAQAAGVPGARMYRTGDLCRWSDDGSIAYFGRNDAQVKLRGFRIELGEIEARLAECTGVRDTTVIVREDRAGDQRLVAYLAGRGVDTVAVRAHLAATLPDYMVPAAFVVLERLPLTPNGKLDRAALAPPPADRPLLAVAHRAPQGDGETTVTAVFAEVLQLRGIGADDNFFDLGGTSLRAVEAAALLKERTGQPLTPATMFAEPTPAGLARALDRAGRQTPPPVGNAPTNLTQHHTDPPTQPAEPSAAASQPLPGRAPIAIIGMAGRFPGAETLEAFWTNLVQGTDCITDFAPGTLDASVPAALSANPAYVRARGVLGDVGSFDAAFFGMSPREAELTDPQHRLFLEIAWECLEHAGHAPDNAVGRVGVYAGVGTPTYLHHHLFARRDAATSDGRDLQLTIGNDKDYVATRVAYKLGLKGPAMAVNTACSTSLVAVTQAVDSLRAGRCDMALAGGASITCPVRSGHLYQDGAMLSSDARTRSFDAGAQGTAFNDGAAVVLLKRLDDALADGDTVYAVVRGAAINNDGGGKASFTAPSVDGQAAVIAAAHDDACIDASSIRYVEAHGTATPLGDPIEVEALNRAFARTTTSPGTCGIGTVKSNVGHLITAAGAAGLIKTALALDRGQLPPSLHYRRPNPHIDFGAGPFYVVDRLTPWPRSPGIPRRAGVSSFGVGGTNAHVVLEESPLRAPSADAVGPQLLQLSARTATALQTMAQRLADHLEANPGLNLADVAHTLQHGRSAFSHRMCVVGSTTAEVVTALREVDAPRRVSQLAPGNAPPLLWLFPGQGAQYAGMGSGLYAADPHFRAAFDACLAALRPVLPFDLQATMFGADEGALQPTSVTQPAIFCLEYALASAWLARGAVPAALIGHSVGEFVAAVLAGVMSLSDAARLVALRGALLQNLPAGSMLSVRAAADRVAAMLPPGVELAAHNAPSACVVAGPTDAVHAFQAELEGSGIAARPLRTSHAFHSSMMDAAVQPFADAVRRVALSPPRIPIFSTLTGRQLSADDAVDVAYWARHLRQPVRFSEALRQAFVAMPSAACLEVGPRAGLSALTRQHGALGGPATASAPVAVASLADTPGAEAAALLLAQGRLWTLRVALPHAANGNPAAGRRRLPLPTYAFDRQRHWIDAPAAVDAVALDVATAATAASAAPDVGCVSPAPPGHAAVSAPTIRPGPATMSTAPTAPITIDRKAHLLARARSTFEEVVGMDLAEADPHTAFVELGLDSLSLTQAALQIKRDFGVAVTFRQLMVQLRNFQALVEYLDASLPPDVQAAPVPTTVTVLGSAVVPSPVIGAVSAASGIQNASLLATLAPTATQPMAGSLVQHVIAQQMQLMAQQLALLGAPAPALSAAAQMAATAQVAQLPVEPVEPVAPASAAMSVPAAVAPAASANAEVPAPLRYDVKKAFGAIARIHTQHSDISERQQVRLDAFMRRYVDRTARSKAYTAQHRPHLADPRVVNGFRPATKEIAYQIVVDRTKGAHLWDLDGNEYVDVLSGFGMSLFGWQPDFVLDAVRKQLDAGYEIGPQHPLSGEVAELLCELTGFERAALCNTGSEAVMAAIRIARTVTGRNLVVSFTGSYHGTFDEVLVRAGRGAKGLPAAPGVLAGAFGDIRVLDYGTPEALDFIRTHADDIAAVLVEPVQSRRPDFQPREFLKALRTLTAERDVCLVFDEVITGFRCHLGGAQAMFDVRADLACYGKVIGGGFPIGVVAGRPAYMDALDGGAWDYGDDSIPTVGVTYFAGTFVRHPLALAAAKASLLHLRQAGPQLQTQLNLHTAALADELTAFCREVGAPLEVHHFASLFRVHWLADHPLQDLLFAMMRSRGVHILDNFPCFLTTAHSLDDIAIVKSAFRESVAELQAAEFLPRRADAVVKADASKPPVVGARLGRDKDGTPAWFVPDPASPSRFRRVEP